LARARCKALGITRVVIASSPLSAASTILTALRLALVPFHSIWPKAAIF
jgi:hypothetical protein